MNRLAEKALRVKSEWVVHQAKFLVHVDTNKKNAQGSSRSSPVTGFALPTFCECTLLDFFFIKEKKQFKSFLFISQLVI